MKSLMLAELIRSNAEVHGAAWAARHAMKRGVNIDVVLHALGFRRVGVVAQVLIAGLHV